MTERLKKALYKSRYFLITGMVLVFALTSFFYNAFGQRNAKDDGLGILMVDVTPGASQITAFEKQVQTLLGFQNVGAFTIDSSAAAEYAATIENYTLFKYIAGQIELDNYDILFISSELIPELAALNCLMPMPEDLAAQISEDEMKNCKIGDTIVAFPIADRPVTPSGMLMSDTEFKPAYAILCKTGDHTDEAIRYLRWIAGQQGVNQA